MNPCPRDHSQGTPRADQRPVSASCPIRPRTIISAGGERLRSQHGALDCASVGETLGTRASRARLHGQKRREQGTRYLALRWLALRWLAPATLTNQPTPPSSGELDPLSAHLTHQSRLETSLPRTSERKGCGVIPDPSQRIFDGARTYSHPVQSIPGRESNKRRRVRPIVRRTTNRPMNDQLPHERPIDQRTTKPRIGGRQHERSGGDSAGPATPRAAITPPSLGATAALDEHPNPHLRLASRPVYCARTRPALFGSQDDGGSHSISH